LKNNIIVEGVEIER